jgi:hypothetical protein
MSNDEDKLKKKKLQSNPSWYDKLKIKKAIKKIKSKFDIKK